MKHCFITPTKFINDQEIGQQGDFLLALSHLIDTDYSNEYSQALREWKATGKPIYLDNGLFENGVPEDTISLLAKAKEFEVDIVFAPDVLFDPEQTWQNFEDFYAAAFMMCPEIKIGFVVQAKDPVDFLAAFKKANSDDRIALIGLSILSVPASFNGEVCGFGSENDITYCREIAIDFIDKMIMGPKKDCHLLGLGGSLNDLVIGCDYDWIKSNDSSSAFVTGLHGLRYRKNEVPGGKVEEKLDFSISDLTSKQYSDIHHNISIIKTIL